MFLILIAISLVYTARAAWGRPRELRSHPLCSHHIGEDSGDEGSSDDEDSFGDSGR